MDPGEGTVSPAVAVAEVLSEARALEQRPDFPHEVIEGVRVATACLAAEPSPGDVRQAAQMLAHQAGVPFEPPMVSSGPVRRLVKRLVSLLVGWYVRMLAQQVAAVGEATARLGLAVAERTERLQAEAASDRAALSARLETLSDRLSRLEAQVDDGAGPGRPPGSP